MRLQKQLLLSTTPFEFGMQIPPPRSVRVCRLLPVTLSVAQPATPDESMLRGCEWRTVPCSDHANKTVNAIRRIVEVMSVKHNEEKDKILLQLGDPTLTGALNTHAVIKNAVVESLKSKTVDGYAPAVGMEKVRYVRRICSWR